MGVFLKEVIVSRPAFGGRANASDAKVLLHEGSLTKYGSAVRLKHVNTDGSSSDLATRLSGNTSIPQGDNHANWTTFRIETLEMDLPRRDPVFTSPYMQDGYFEVHVVVVIEYHDTFSGNVSRRYEPLCLRTVYMCRWHDGSLRLVFAGLLISSARSRRHRAACTRSPSPAASRRRSSGS
jgi:hypothetical protein